MNLTEGNTWHGRSHGIRGTWVEVTENEKDALGANQGVAACLFCGTFGYLCFLICENNDVW